MILKTQLGLLVGALLALGCTGVASTTPETPAPVGVCGAQLAAHSRCAADRGGDCTRESSEVAACWLAEVNAASSDAERFDRASLLFWDGGEVYGENDQREQAKAQLMRALPGVVADIERTRSERRYESAISRVRFVEGVVRQSLGPFVLVEETPAWKSVPRERELFAEAVRFHVERFDAQARAGRPSSSARHACRAATLGRELATQDTSVATETAADVVRARQACEAAFTSPARRRRDVLLSEAPSGLMRNLAKAADGQANAGTPRLRVFDVQVELSETEPQKTVCVEQRLDAYMVPGGSAQSRVERPCIAWQTKSRLAFSLELSWPADAAGPARSVLGGQQRAGEFNHDMPLGNPNEEAKSLADARARKMTAEQLLSTVQLDGAVFAAVDALGVIVALERGDADVLEEACARLLEQEPADTDAAARLFPRLEPAFRICPNDADELALYASPYSKGTLGFVGYLRH
jgi:hypothetical protein